MEKKIIIDTNFWIYIKDNQGRRKEFQKNINENDTEVLFSSGNFIDLLKGNEQDELSEIIASTTDKYIPMQSYTGNSYEISETPASLIPNDSDRREFFRQTRYLDDDLALRYLFRTADWETPEFYISLTNTMKDIYDKFGFENSMGYIFKEYLEFDGEQAKLSQQDIDVPEFIRSMLELNRIDQIKESENPDVNDFADMEICAHALITDCDYLFIESKWIDTGTIEKVVAELNREGPTLYDDFDDFQSALKR